MEDLSENLQELGLSGREAEIYLALLTKKEMTAPEVAKITSVTRTKSYEILQNLIKKRVCNEKYKNGTKVFSSIEPTIAIQNMLSVYENELNKKKKIAELFKEDLIELHKLKEEKEDPLDYIEVLTDVGQIRKKWLNIQKNTIRELLYFTKPPYTSSNIIDNVAAEAKLINNNVNCKSIYEYGITATIEEKKNLVRVVEEYNKIGEESRIIKELPMKLAISDETITMLALNDRISLKSSITTIIVDHPNFAKAQKEVFEVYWMKGIPVDEFKRDIERKEKISA